MSNQEPALNEVLHCKPQKNNTADQYAVTVYQHDKIVRHIPMKISRVCAGFFKANLVVQSHAMRRTQIFT
jgi:acyl-coenzyme A thioesterase PaaI-like protein